MWWQCHCDITLFTTGEVEASFPVRAELLDYWTTGADKETLTSLDYDLQSCGLAQGVTNILIFSPTSMRKQQDGRKGMWDVWKCDASVSRSDQTKYSDICADIQMSPLLFATDFGDPCNRGVRGHDSQGEAAALVQADNRGLCRRTMWQLHNLLERWEVIQCHHP